MEIQHNFHHFQYKVFATEGNEKNKLLQANACGGTVGDFRKKDIIIYFLRILKSINLFDKLVPRSLQAISKFAPIFPKMDKVLIFVKMWSNLRAII